MIPAEIHDLVKDILEYDPKNGDYIKVAQLGSYTEKSLNSRKDSNTVLVSSGLISKIKPSHINVVVDYNGRDYRKDVVYKPAFHIYLSQASGLQKVEPLVVSWESHNNTVLIPEQGFLQTYELIPRLTQEITYWDDLSKPEYEVVENKPTSIYDFPDISEAYVKIRYEYLLDYITLRKKTALHIYQEIRTIQVDNKIAALLTDSLHYFFEDKQYAIRIQRQSSDDSTAQLEVTGFVILFNSLKEEPVQNIIEPIGHTWKGIEGIVTGDRARHSMAFQYAYVSDDVLDRFEGDKDYQLYPQSGSVYFGRQWAVSNCERVGRNAIKIELKKLYEGTPYKIIDYWNKFSIDPSTIDKNQKNIASRAESLFNKYLLFGRVMSGLINNLTNLNSIPIQVHGFDEAKLKTEGILQNIGIQPIAYHVNYKSFKRDQFISRCKELYKIFGESLQENTLRKTVNGLGFDKEKTKPLRAIKLLNLILSYTHKAEECGLDPMKDNIEIIYRLGEVNKFNWVEELMALNDLRQLDAHKRGGDFDSKMNKGLKIFGIDSNAISNNYAFACDQVYDKLDDYFTRINQFLIK